MSFISELDKEEELSSTVSDESLTDPDTSDENFSVDGEHKCGACLRLEKTTDKMEHIRSELLSERSKLMAEATTQFWRNKKELDEFAVARKDYEDRTLRFEMLNKVMLERLADFKQPYKGSCWSKMITSTFLLFAGAVVAIAVLILVEERLGHD